METVLHNKGLDRMLDDMAKLPEPTGDDHIRDIARNSAQAAIRSGHLQVTADIADGTIVTEHVSAYYYANTDFRWLPKLVVIRREDGQLGLYQRREVAYGIESTHILYAGRLDQYTIDPKDTPIDCEAERMAYAARLPADDPYPLNRWQKKLRDSKL